MKRLEKKCLLASLGMHGLLATTLLIGSAFRSSESRRAEPRQPGEAAVPVATSGDSPLFLFVAAPAVEPASLTEPSAPGSIATPPGTVTALSPLVLDRNGWERTHVEGRGLPVISTNLRVRPHLSSQTATKGHPQAISAQQLQESLDRLSRSLSRGGPLTLNIGATGSEGDKDSAYEQIVKDTYTRYWHAAGTEANQEPATTAVRVIIASDGRVIQKEIFKASGDPTLDRSVQRVLADVAVIAPFGDGVREKQRTYTINFHLRDNGAGTE
jgi:TonB family protein